jgi:hypothetical protein
VNFKSDPWAINHMEFSTNEALDEIKASGIQIRDMRRRIATLTKTYLSNLYSCPQSP